MATRRPVAGVGWGQRERRSRLRCTSVINAFDEIDRTWATYTCHESADRTRTPGKKSLRTCTLRSQCGRQPRLTAAQSTTVSSLWCGAPRLHTRGSPVTYPRSHGNLRTPLSAFCDHCPCEKHSEVYLRASRVHEAERCLMRRDPSETRSLPRSPKPTGSALHVRALVSWTPTFIRP